MGRVPTPQRPTGSSRDPAESARVAAIKQGGPSKTTTPAGQASAPTTPVIPPMPENLKKSLAGLDEEGLRNALTLILKARKQTLPEGMNKDRLRQTLSHILENNHLAARATFQAFCNPPAESAEGSQNPNRYYDHCSHALRAYSFDVAMKEIESIFGKMEAFYKPEEVPWSNKFAGNRWLLHIAALVDPTRQSSPVDPTTNRRRYEVIFKAFQAMATICVSMDLGDCEHLYDTNEWREFVRRCKSVGHGLEQVMMREVEAQLDDVKGDEMSYSEEIEFRALELQYDMENEDEDDLSGSDDGHFGRRYRSKCAFR
jgi:hypothetical protein